MRLNRFDREMLALAVPALGALAADPLVSMVDTVFVGRLGVVPLAALGVNTSVFSLAFVIFNFLAYATTPLVAREVGREDRERAGQIAVQALVLAGSVGLVVVAALEWMAVSIVQLMGATGELVGPAVTYLRIRALAGPAVLFITAGHGIFRGYQDTRTPLVVTLILNGVNLVLDPVLIFGFGWGLAGAAWATVVAQWTGAVGFLWLVLVKRRGPLGVERSWPQLRDLLSFLRIGGELATRTLALIGTMTLATAIATRVGTVAVAAHQVAGQLWLLLALIIDGLAVAGQAMVAQYRGRGNETAARAASNRLLVWGLGAGSTLGLAFVALRPLLPRLFTEDTTVISAVDSVLPFVIFMQPLNALVFVWDGIFLGAERFRYLALQMGISAVAGGAVLLLVLPFGWGLQGVWWGMVALMVTRAVTLAVEYYSPRMRPRPSPEELEAEQLRE